MRKRHQSRWDRFVRPRLHFAVPVIRLLPSLILELTDMGRGLAHNMSACVEGPDRFEGEWANGGRSDDRATNGLDSESDTCANRPAFAGQATLEGHGQANPTGAAVTPVLLPRGGDTSCRSGGDHGSMVDRSTF